MESETQIVSFNYNSTWAARRTSMPPKKNRVYSQSRGAQYARKWREEHPNGCSVTCCRRELTKGRMCDLHKEIYYRKSRKKAERIRFLVISHYGKGSVACCVWDDCEVSDMDMLSIDHINNDGAKARRQDYNGSGTGLYRKLKKEGYPEGYQTLCHNHQWKKEALRRRSLIIDSSSPSEAPFGSTATSLN